MTAETATKKLDESKAKSEDELKNEGEYAGQPHGVPVFFCCRWTPLYG